MNTFQHLLSNPIFSLNPLPVATFGRDNTNPNHSFPWTRHVLVSVLCRIINELIEEEDKPEEEIRPGHYYLFYYQKPKYQIFSIIDHIVECFDDNISSYVVMLVYLNRIKKYINKLPITFHNWPIVLFVCLYVAVKYTSQCYGLTSFRYCWILGMTRDQLNCLEVLLVVGLDFELYVSKEKYNQYLEYMISLALPAETLRDIQ